jgi:protein SCO1/2
MTLRTARILVAAGAFVAGLVLFGAVLLLVMGRGEGPGLPQAASIGGPFSLTDQNGRTVTEQDLKGRPFLVFFGYTNCPDFCPTTMFEISEVLKALGPDADRTRALFITVDPERDTQAALKDYLSSFDPHIIALTGEPDAIAAVAKSYRAYYRKVPLKDGSYTMDHLVLVYLMDKNGRFVSRFNLNRPIDASVAELRKYL